MHFTKIHCIQNSLHTKITAYKKIRKCITQKNHKLQNPQKNKKKKAKKKLFSYGKYKIT